LCAGGGSETTAMKLDFVKILRNSSANKDELLKTVRSHVKNGYKKKQNILKNIEIFRKALTVEEKNQLTTSVESVDAKPLTITTIFPYIYNENRLPTFQSFDTLLPYDDIYAKYIPKFNNKNNSLLTNGNGKETSNEDGDVIIIDDSPKNKTNGKNKNTIVCEFVEIDSESGTETHNVIDLTNNPKKLQHVYDSYINLQDSTLDGGVPRRAWLYKNVDFVNLPFKLHRYCGKYHKASVLEFNHIHSYLTAKEFNKDLLKSCKYDHVINAIFSFILSWNDESLRRFAELHSTFEVLMTIIERERAVDNYEYIYNYFGYPITKMAIKYLKKYFENIERINAGIEKKKIETNTFNWVKYIDRSFIEHIRKLYTELRSDTVSVETIKSLEQYMPIPYKFSDLCEDLDKLRGSSTFKFISGQACCGKTTILNTLSEKYGWKVYSRGDLGSFSGKATSAAAIGNLHAALNFSLTKSDVIGDRGHIDNIIWSFIMPACDEQTGDTLVVNMFQFLTSEFNQLSIMNFISHKGVIFIDPYPNLNRERMRARGTGGDAHRSRITLYPIVQCIVYYTVARLFGWPVYCVPYTGNRIFSPNEYEKICKKLKVYFGEAFPTKYDTAPMKKGHIYAKPSNTYIINNVYPKSVGIFK